MTLAIEQYITHVKISEDPDNPSAPSPPGTDASKRKHRYIVVSGFTFDDENDF